MKKPLLIFILLTAFASRGVTQDDVVPPSDKTRVDVKAAFGELKKACEDRDFAKAFPQMSVEGADRFVADCLFGCIEIAKELSRDPVGKKIGALNKELGLSSKLIPKAYFSDDSISNEEFDKAMDTADRNLLNAIGKRPKQGEALKKIFAFFDGLPDDEELKEEMYHPFEGEVKEIVGDDKHVTVVIETAYEDDFLTFDMTDNGWKWSGYDDEMMMEAMNEPFALIDDIKLTGKTFAGNDFALTDMKDKVVLVDFWGTWCGPCVAELPALKKIHKALNSKGFEIVGVAQDDKSSLTRFFKTQPLPWQNILDPDGEIADEFKVSGFPTVLLVNKEGRHYASDFFGAELLDEVVKELGLDAKDYQQLREDLSSSEEMASEDGSPGVGFPFADADGDGNVSSKEMKTYLRERLQNRMPFRKIFARLDKDENNAISEEEFEERHAAIEHFMGQGYLSGGLSTPKDPGPEFVPFRSLTDPVDDRDIFGAIFHRYNEVSKTDGNWPSVKLKKVPQSVSESLSVPELKQPTTVTDLIKATVILAGGGEDYFSAGAVLISDDGLAVTNYHVAEGLKNSKMVGMTHDGKTHRVIEMLAGDRARDVALVRFEGEGFPYVKIAAEVPAIGDDLVMVHHSENRFFTYDRGYVMRHPTIGKHPWMEVSMDYAPGGSGCGIFNKDRELVGLVSTINFGDGPSIAEPFSDSKGKDWQSSDEYTDEAIIMVKQAVSLSAIQSLWKQ